MGKMEGGRKGQGQRKGWSMPAAYFAGGYPWLQGRLGTAGCPEECWHMADAPRVVPAPCLSTPLPLFLDSAYASSKSTGREAGLAAAALG